MKTHSRRPVSLARAKATIASLKDSLTQRDEEVSNLRQLKILLQGKLDTLRADFDRVNIRPSAFDRSRGREVPLIYWGHTDLLSLLHDLETRTISNHLEIASDGSSHYPRVPMPEKLYGAVVAECEKRGIIRRRFAEARAAVVTDDATE